MSASHLARAGWGLARRGGAVLLDAVLPPRCLACGQTTADPGLLCARCWAAVVFLGPPCCAQCGLIFPYELGAGALCAACIGDPPAFARARSVMRYDEASRGMILAFKHGDRLDAAPSFGRWMARAGAELLADADLLVPVPLHWTRLFWRRYNQAALLAQGIERAGGPKAAVDVLVRRRRTPSQGQLGAAARFRNVEGAFAVRPGRSVRGRKIVLVDDVLTTGATVEACTRVLKRAGALRVDVLTLARAGRAGA